ncbi:MAG: DVU_1551 family NTP transferase [Thermodesulfobacteriota bacterium]
MNRPRITALILAAGFSSRMGRFKPLLPMGESTVLERVVEIYRWVGIEEIGCVVGHRRDELIPLLRNLGVRPIRNAGYEEGMFSSVVAGIDSLPVETECFFIHPVDIPLVRPSTLARLLEIREEHPQAILFPIFKKERGHPPLIPNWCIHQIRNWKGGGGLRGFLIRNEASSVNVPVADRFIHKDMDSPEDYQLLVDDLKTYEFPDFEECRTLMTEILRVEDRIRRHCRAVTDIALRLGIALNQANNPVNLHLIRAAGLLHDAAKSEPDHARAGARMLHNLGYPAVADAVEQHMDVRIRKDEPPCEAEIVYLADKLVQGDQRVDPEARFERKSAKYGHDPDARAAIARRKADALHIQDRIQGITGKSVSVILDAAPSLSELHDLSFAAR